MSIFVTYNISLLFPKEIQVEYQEEEYKLVNRQTNLLNTNWDSFAHWSFEFNAKAGDVLDIRVESFPPDAIYLFKISKSIHTYYEKEGSGWGFTGRWTVVEDGWHSVYMGRGSSHGPGSSGQLTISKSFSS